MSTVATPASSLCPSFVDIEEYDEEHNDDDDDNISNHSCGSEKKPMTEEDKQYFYLTLIYLFSIGVNLLCVFGCVLYYNRLKTYELELQTKYVIIQNDFKELFQLTMNIMQQEMKISLEEFNRFGKHAFEISLFDK